MVIFQNEIFDLVLSTAQQDEYPLEVGNYRFKNVSDTWVPP
jgi:hypothetical protein